MVALILDLSINYFTADKSNQDLQPLYNLASHIAEQQQSAESFPIQLNNMELRATPGADVQLASDELHDQPFILITSNNKTSLYWLSTDKKTLFSLGRITQPETSAAWPAWVFYGSLFTLLALWLRPLLRDIDQIVASVDAFRKNYRAPMTELNSSSNLKPLANHITAMAEQIRRQIDAQKDLTNVLSHEMRTPLSRIKFSLALLKPQENLTEQQRSELDGIDQDTAELEQLTKAMLDFAKLDHPDMAIERQRIEPKQWLESYVEKQQRHISGVELTTVLELPANNPGPHLLADPYWLELALNNLISNSLRYAKHQIQLRLTLTENSARLAVADDGPGIAPEQQPQVTKPFYQADSRPQKGFGLGLALVKRIAELHNGTIVVGAAELGGAEISVTVYW